MIFPNISFFHMVVNYWTGPLTLNKFRYRLTPEGKMRELYTKDPAFGVYLALKKPGRIQVGDEVLVRYKPTPF
jgi:uncharacterized protein YcbX